MANLVVGDKGCTFKQILDIVKGSSQESEVLRDWKDLAREMGTNLLTVHDLDRDIMLDKKSRMDVFERILIDWRSRNAGNSTLNELMILVKKCKWTKFKEDLRKLANDNAAGLEQLELDSHMDEVDNAEVQYNLC